MIVVYNLVIGILLVLASDKIASAAKFLGTRFQRYAKVSLFTLGSCIAAVSGSVYIAFHVLRIGIE
jgi:hypothetical protein